MTGKTHQVIGLTAGLGSYLFFTSPSYQPATLAFILVVSSISALLPDIDQPGSRIWRMLPFGHLAGEVVNPFMQHRNLSHSFLGYGIVALLSHLLIYAMPSYWGVNYLAVWIAVLVAYGSHLLADSVTVEGIPLFFPYQHMYGLPPFPLQALRIETGHWFENLVVFPLVNLGLLVLLWSERGMLHTLLFH